ncbi:MAG: DNA topoisomerase IB [Planctomycetota bacterium]
MTSRPDQFEAIQLDPIRAAQAAQLRYVTDDEPGISRRRFGKGFAYYLPGGKKLTRRPQIQRVKSLAVPPAYKDVWICIDDRGHLQATGRDAAGRKQYRYHDRWAEVRDAAKFAGLVAFAEKLPTLRRRVRKDLKLKGLPRDKVLAACVRLLDRTLIRIGNADYAKRNDSFGLTTLRDEHATFDGKTVRFDFTGKHGIERELEVRDGRLARIVKACQELPGQELLQYQNDRGDVIDVGSTDVNAYLHDIAGDAITAKDFRTWHGTVAATAKLAKTETAETKTAINRQIVAVIDDVAELLGNTRAVARNSYVHPGVIACFEEGRLAEAVEKADAVRELTQAESQTLHVLRTRQP